LSRWWWSVVLFLFLLLNPGFCGFLLHMHDHHPSFCRVYFAFWVFAQNSEIQEPFSVRQILDSDGTAFTLSFFCDKLYSSLALRGSFGSTCSCFLQNCGVWKRRLCWFWTEYHKGIFRRCLAWIWHLLLYACGFFLSFNLTIEFRCKICKLSCHYAVLNPVFIKSDDFFYFYLWVLQISIVVFSWLLPPKFWIANLWTFEVRLVI